MKVKLTEELLLKTLETTNLEFDIKALYILIDKMPTAYYRQIILDEFFQHLCGIPFYEVYDVLSGRRDYFFSKKNLVRFCEKNKIASDVTITGAIKSGSKVKKRYVFRYFMSSRDYDVCLDVRRSDGSSVLDSSADGTATVDDASVDGVDDGA